LQRIGIPVPLLIMLAYLWVKSLVVRTNVPQFVGIAKTIRVDRETDKFFTWATKNEDTKGAVMRHVCGGMEREWEGMGKGMGREEEGIGKGCGRDGEGKGKGRQRGNVAQWHQVSNTIEKATCVRVCKTLFLRQSASGKVVSKGLKGNNHGWSHRYASCCRPAVGF